MRINKYLAHCGVASRRKAETLINEGRVTINGEVVTELGTYIYENQVVALDGEPVESPEQYKTLIIHKPVEYIVSQDDPQGRKLIYELLPPGLKHFRYVGRLDFLSRGLLIMTEDGELSRRLTHPDFQLEREYHVTLNRELGPRSIRKMENGVEIEGGHVSRPELIKSEGKTADIILYEGKKREVREMMKALGYRVQDLLRLRYGPIKLDDLPEGEYRILSKEEQEGLYEIVQEAPRPRY